MTPGGSESGSVFTVFTLFGTLFLATADNQLLIPLLPTLARELSIDTIYLGWLFSGYALAAAVSSLTLGPLTDRFGRVRFLFIGLFLLLVTGLCTYFVNSFSQLVLLRIMAGFAGGLLSTCTAGLVGDRFAYANRGRVMGIVLSSYFVALIVGIPVAGFLADRWNWRVVFLVLSILAAALLLTALLHLSKEKRKPEETSKGSYLSAYSLFLRRSETRSAVLVSFGVSGATLSFLTFISKYLDEAFGLGPLEIAWLFLLSGVAAAVSSPVAGWLSDHYTKRGIFLVFNTALALPLFLLGRVSWGIPLFSVFFFISLSVAFRQTALQTLQTELVSGLNRGAFLALRNAFSQLGISVCVWVAGSLYQGAGYQAVTTWAICLTLLSSILLYGAVREPSTSR